MAPWGASSSASESEDDTPETLSFNSSKKAAKGVEHAQQEYEANERRKQKEANRERDRRLKERAEAKEKEKEAAASSTSKRKTRDRKVKQPASEKSDDESEGGDAAGPRNELEARMARAMQEAEQESDEGDGGEDDEEAAGSASDGSADEEDASEDDSDAQNSESESGSSQSGSEEEEEEPEATAHPKRMPSAPTYLPDELFKAAFSKAASSSKRRLDAEDEPDEASPRPRKQRKPAKRVGKDITVGLRTIRTLTPVNPAVPTTIPRAMVPPRTVNKFVKRSLNLKGKAQAAQAKGWQRRKANVGVMKRNGPAANFARNGGYT